MQLHLLRPERLEQLVCELLGRAGYEVGWIGGASDRGADIIAKRYDPLLGREIKYVVQVKRYSPDHRVGAREIRRLYDALLDYKADMGIFVTTSDFTAEARRLAEETYGGRIVLWNAHKLRQLIEKFDLKLPKDYFEVEERAPKKMREAFEAPVEDAGLRLNLRFVETKYPLLFPLDVEELVYAAVSRISQACAVSREVVSVVGVEVTVASCFIIEWVARYHGYDSMDRLKILRDADRALVYPDGSVVLYTSEDAKIKSLVARAIRRSRDTMYATSVRYERGVGVREAVRLVKDAIIREYGSDLVQIELPPHRRWVALLPVSVRVDARVAEGGAEAVYYPLSQKFELSLSPLSEVEVVKRVKSALRAEGYDVLSAGVAELGDVSALVVCESRDFMHRLRVHRFTGRISFSERELKREAAGRIARGVVPGGTLISLVREGQIYYAVVQNGRAYLVMIDASNGEVLEAVDIISKERTAELVSDFIEANFNDAAVVEEVRFRPEYLWWVKARSNLADYTFLIDSRTGEVKEYDRMLTESGAIAAFRNHLLEYVGSRNMTVEKVRLRDDGLYVVILVSSSEEGTPVWFYGLVDGKTALVRQYDVLVEEGLKSKFKKKMLDFKYR